MKSLSVVILGVLLSISNIVMADTGKEQKKAEALEQVKLKILQSVTARIEVLNKFKSCVEMIKTRPELEICRMDKKSAMQELKIKNQQDRENRMKAKGMETKPST